MKNLIITLLIVIHFSLLGYLCYQMSKCQLMFITDRHPTLQEVLKMQPEAK